MLRVDVQIDVQVHRWRIIQVLHFCVLQYCHRCLVELRVPFPALNGNSLNVETSQAALHHELLHRSGAEITSNLHTCNSCLHTSISSFSDSELPRLTSSKLVTTCSCPYSTKLGCTPQLSIEVTGRKAFSEVKTG